MNEKVEGGLQVVDKPETKPVEGAEVKPDVVVKERAEQIPFGELITAFVKSGFKPDKMDEQFKRKSGTCRARLRFEFSTKHPDKVETKDGKDVVTPGKERPEGTKLRNGLSAKVKAALGEDKERECVAAIDELYKDMRVGGSGRAIDRDAILASLEFNLE